MKPLKGLIIGAGIFSGIFFASEVKGYDLKVPVRQENGICVEREISLPEETLQYKITDVNHDGRDEVIAIIPDEKSLINKVVIYYQKSDGTFTSAENIGDFPKERDYKIKTLPQ